MILEGIVTTIDEAGDVNVSPMGPTVDAEMRRFILRPYRTSRTFRNLERHPEGVFHVTDDVELIARAAVGETHPPVLRAHQVRGHYLRDACRWYEFRVVDFDDREERSTIEVAVVHSGRLRDFFGFHRARHAVVEAAILATRTAFLEVPEILRKFDELAILVDKTGGEHEHRAFQFLRDFVESQTPEGYSGSAAK